MRYAPRPWYRKGRQMWMATIGKDQIPLGVTDPADRPAAEAAMAKLVEQMAVAVAAKIARPSDADYLVRPTNNTGPTVSAAITGYLTKCEKEVAAGRLGSRSLANYRRLLDDFAAAFGEHSLPEVAANALEAVESWADRPGWSSSYQRQALGLVKAAFAHARVVLPVRRPPGESRGAECVVSDERFGKVLATLGTRTDFPQVLRLLRETGARPGEVSPLTVEAIDWPNRCVRLKQHKTHRKTGRDRIITFSSAAMAVLESQRARHGSGLLFRTRAGRAYSTAVIGDRLRNLAAKIGGRLIAYGLGRHSYATKALVAGESDTVVAALLGHKGTQMIHLHYSHVSEDARAMRAAAERVASKAG